MEYLQYYVFVFQASQEEFQVLNLIINGIPSIHDSLKNIERGVVVLNLIINGIPSIQIKEVHYTVITLVSFKPYYKWNTFNTIT